MTKAYLEKIKTHLVEEKSSLEKRKSNLENTIAENEKFTELLDESNDPNFESFTPRTVNGRNKEKIKQLNHEQKELIKEKEQIEEHILFINVQLEECQKVLQYEYEQEKIKIEEQDHVKLNEDTVQKLTDILQKLRLSLEVIDVDTQRCRLELSDAIQLIDNLMSGTDKK